MVEGKEKVGGGKPGRCTEWTAKARTRKKPIVMPPVQVGPDGPDPLGGIYIFLSLISAFLAGFILGGVFYS